MMPLSPLPFNILPEERRQEKVTKYTDWSVTCNNVSDQREHDHLGRKPQTTELTLESHTLQKHWV